MDEAALRARYELFNSGQIAVWIASLHPEIEWRESVLLPTGVYNGHEGVTEWLANGSAALSGVRFEVLAVAIDGSTAINRVRVTGHGTGSGAPFERIVFQAMRWGDDDLITFVGAYSDEDSARAALSG